MDTNTTVLLLAGVVERVSRCPDLLDRWKLEKTMDRATDPYFHLLKLAEWRSCGDRPALDAANLSVMKPVGFRHRGAAAGQRCYHAIDDGCLLDLIVDLKGIFHGRQICCACCVRRQADRMLCCCGRRPWICFGWDGALSSCSRSWLSMGANGDVVEPINERLPDSMESNAMGKDEDLLVVAGVRIYLMLLPGVMGSAGVSAAARSDGCWTVVGCWPDAASHDRWVCRQMGWMLAAD
ncbi:hypothetical protein ACLOJK_028526, partial [Asimina triloba]